MNLTPKQAIDILEHRDPSPEQCRAIQKLIEDMSQEEGSDYSLYADILVVTLLVGALVLGIIIGIVL